MEELDFAEVMERSVDSFRPQTSDKEVKITLAGKNETGDCVPLGDSHLLERAISNLLDNAIRHTPTGGLVTVKWGIDRTQITFSIADTGPGFATHDLTQVFDPLYRGEASRNREIGGAGLGLTIAKRIIGAHGGDLIARNQATGGALLEGWIPCAAKAKPPRSE